jgi:hypothetical protein
VKRVSFPVGRMERIFGAMGRRAADSGHTSQPELFEAQMQKRIQLVI